MMYFFAKMEDSYVEDSFRSILFVLSTVSILLVFSRNRFGEFAAKAVFRCLVESRADGCTSHFPHNSSCRWRFDEAQRLAGDTAFCVALVKVVHVAGNEAFLGGFEGGSEARAARDGFCNPPLMTQQQTYPSWLRQ